ncbi:calcium channel YVC1 [Echria macrotheca]|uniref:Calcium channel YVC1 n=1 Tax=Echria macrotheca TaxID=438768 RepID=A0AAJ0BKE0_9PEZI|nr:calcium channel YVC1 [Echria macrotheca]
MTMQVVRPLVDRLFDPNDLSTVYCLLANRVQFLRSQSEEALHQTVNIARAILCELVAARILRRFHEENPGRSGLLLLSNILVSGFDAFDAAPEPMRRQSRASQWHAQDRDGHERKLMALELAILSESKILIASVPCQRVVDAVHRGLVVYTPLSLVDILPDHYKFHPVSLYEPRRASILNHHRLIVPRLRNLIELAHFTILLALYVLTMVHCNGNPHGTRQMGIYEAAFVIFTAGWVLEQFAAIIEHGWEVHAQNLWSFLDITFIFIYGLYGIVRVVELLVGIDINYALPILCIAAPILLTRIAFNLMPDNIVFIALHAMMRDFTRLTFIAIWCFTGFLLGLFWLMRTNFALDPSFETTPGWATIGKWLLWIWFGLDGTGIERTADFHLILGPALTVTFAFLGNTLFLTILVAILTNTFSKIMNNAAAEVQFRHTVLTFQGVKSDAIFSYPPPFNMVALVIMLPLRFFLGAATFHNINVAVIRTINAPLLLLIALYERRRVWARGMLPSVSTRQWHHFGLSPYGDIQLVFSAEPPPDVLDRIEKLDVLDSTFHHDVDRKSTEGERSSFVRRRKPSGDSERSD